MCISASSKAASLPAELETPDRGTDVTATMAFARTPERGALVRAVCIREWREALGNRLLVAMTLLPPVVILAAGIGAVAAAAANPPSDRDIPAVYAAAPAAARLDPTE